MVDTKAASEFRSMDTFYKMMNSDPNRAHYGYKAVLRAADNQAIDTLLVSDSLFRADNIETRKRYIELVELVKLTSGTVHIFSSAHVTGEQLDQVCSTIFAYVLYLTEMRRSSPEWRQFCASRWRRRTTISRTPRRRSRRSPLRIQ